MNLYEPNYYSFMPNADTNSYRNRFMLVYERMTPSSSNASTAVSETTNIELYPNPVTTGQKLTVRFNNMPAGDYSVSISTMAGKQVLYKTIAHKKEQNNYTLSLSSAMISGEYTVKVTGKNNIGYEMKLIIAR
jgi:hypothetical protein